MILVVLAGILLVLMLAVGGDRGAKSFVALVGNLILFVACVFFLSMGANAYLVTIACALLFCAVTIVYQNGWNACGWASVAAVLLDLCLVAGVAFALGRCGKIAGYSELDMREEISMYLSVNLRIDMRALGLAVIAFGFLGAAMDAAVSVSAAVRTIHEEKPALDARALTRAGNAVGRDILGTTANTVFFAGIGETIMQTILFFKNGYTVEAILNSKAFLQLFSLIMISNLACLAVIPLSSFLAGYALTSGRAYFARLRGEED